MSATDAPLPRPGERATLGARARRALPSVAGLVLGLVAGALLHAARPGLVAVAPAALLGLGLAALVVVAFFDDRRLAEDLAAAGPDAAPPRPPILRGGPVGRLVHGALGGLVLVWVAVQGSPGLAAVLLVTLAPFGLVVSLMARSGIRRRLDAARAAHPGAGVVVASFAGTGGIAWGRWARVAGVRVPPRAEFSSLLLADADGLEQRVLHDGARLHRWSWDEVELSRAPDPDRPRASDRAALVLTLLGPLPAPRTRAVPARRQRSDVTMRLMDASWSVSTPAAVDAAIATLRGAPDGPGDGDERG